MKFKQQFWLLMIAVTLIVINIHIFAQFGDRNLKAISVFFGIVILSSLWNKRQNLIIDSDNLSRVIGGLLIILIIGKSIFAPQINLLFQITPFLSALGLGFIAFGCKTKQFSRELILLFTLSIPFEILISHLFDLANLTAQYASLIISYLGFYVSQKGTAMLLHTGGIRVTSACSGLNVVAQMLRLAILHNVMFPGKWSRDILVVVVAVFIGFTGNAIRVGTLAILSDPSQKEIFDYFHGVGGHIFVAISVLTFGLFCYVMMQMTQNINQNNLD